MSLVWLPVGGWNEEWQCRFDALVGALIFAGHFHAMTYGEGTLFWTNVISERG